MKCNNCGSQWQIAEHLHVTVHACPFCGNSLELEKHPIPTHAETYTSKETDFDIAANIVRGYHGSCSEVFVPEGIVETGAIVPGQGAFYGNTSIRKLVFPKSMKRIAPHACYQCRNLEEVIIPDGVESIGEYAFYNCSSLKRIHLPSSLNKIEWHVFSNCSSLEAITIPGTIKEIGSWAFSDCRNLRTVEIRQGVEIIHSSAFESCTSLTDVILPSGLAKIDYNAFKNCFHLARIVIPETVQQLGTHKPYTGPIEGPFTNCTGLYDITHPPRFGSLAFSGTIYYRSIKKIEEEQHALELQRKEQEQQRIRSERLSRGRCPDCDKKFTLFGKLCPKCGKRF